MLQMLQILHYPHQDEDYATFEQLQPPQKLQMPPKLQLFNSGGTFFTIWPAGPHFSYFFTLFISLLYLPRILTFLRFSMNLPETL